MAGINKSAGVELEAINIGFVCFNLTFPELLFNNLEV